MTKRKLMNCGRKKAPFGSQEAAILAAAGINAATQLVSAGINSSATKQAAKDQATAINQQATKQAQAIKDQTNKTREYQQESQEFIKEQNAENRALQKDIQLQLQMLAGQQNVNDRLEASKITVRNGGSTRRKLRNAANVPSLLRGSNNLPFVVTDGGGVIKLGQTPEGYDLYELYGNDHEHYHKAQGGKHKTGVGIKFADGNVVEGEGNQNSNKGEKMLVTPTNAYFISRHTLAGFNPAKSVDKGMNPIAAYALQEKIKAAKGISDDGSPVKKMMVGGNFINNLYNENGPQLGVDTVGDTSVGVAYVMKNDKPKLRNGGRCRRTMKPGGPVINGAQWDWTTGTWVTVEPQRRYNGPLAYENQPVTTPAGSVVSTQNNTSTTNTQSTPVSTTRGNGLWNSADLWGAGISGVGNLGAAWITSAANRSAAKTLSNAYNSYADILADAYRNMQTIDMSSIKKDDYAAAHVMPALQAPVSQSAAPLALANRALHRRLENAGKYSASGAAAQERMARAEIDTQDARNTIHAQDQQQMQNIRQQNAQRINEAAIKNAELDTAANQQYANAYLNMLEYNNDIVNQRILGAANASAEGVLNSNKVMSQAQTANAQTWAQALTGSTQGFTNSLTNMANRKADIASALLGSTSDSQAAYYANLASRKEAKDQYDSLSVQRAAALKSGDTETAKRLARQMNAIASKRGFPIV